MPTFIEGPAASASLFRELSMGELRTGLRFLGQTSATTKLANEKAFADQVSADRDRATAVVLQAQEGSNAFCILPPPDYDWMAFQRIRQQIKGMAVGLTDLIDGTAMRHNKTDHRVLWGY